MLLLAPKNATKENNTLVWKDRFCDDGGVDELKLENIFL